ncbi:molecular chaperone DnaJ [Zymomonas sp.]|uniref:molecular chaperone DnaJ n=1 Tax=Zymomonas sp. TaxID=2068624 RepID=UPI0025F08893|nr:molecular chaperone DnaJ [Zymomonas sp.]MCA1956228.1 molecular chaperone DnaJ [Zymomonas sp.]
MQILTLLALALALWSWCRPVAAALRIGDLAALIAGLGGFSLLVKGEVIPAVIAILGASIWFLKRQNHASVAKDRAKKYQNFRDSFASAYSARRKKESFKPYSPSKKPENDTGSHFQNTAFPKSGSAYSAGKGNPYPSAQKATAAPLSSKADRRADIINRIQKIGIPQNRSDALKLLGLDEQADKISIKKSYHQLIALVHPDAGGSEEWARHVNIARDILLKFNAG